MPKNVHFALNVETRDPDFLDARNEKRKIVEIPGNRDVETRRAATLILINTRCLKITEKVSFNIVSEASYVYILSVQKFIKNAKNGQFWRVFENLKLAVKQCYQTGHF